MSQSRMVRRSSISVVLVALLAALVPIGASAADDVKPRRNYIVELKVAEGEKIIRPNSRENRQRIRLRAERTERKVDRVRKDHGLKVRHRYTRALSGFSARMTAKEANQLRRDPNVAAVLPSVRYRPAAQTVQDAIERVKAVPTGAPDVDADVAILDTGIGPVGGGELAIAGGVNCSGDGQPADSYDDLYAGQHGTHVAGLAAARDNTIGGVGTAPGARLWSVRVFTSGGFGDTTTIVCGLDWVIAHGGIEVVNMSIQGERPAPFLHDCSPTPTHDPFHMAVCNVHAAGITMVVSAGNSSTDAEGISPAGYDQVVTVGALSDFDGVGGGQANPNCAFYQDEVDDTYAGYSNYGEDVDIVAPGTCVRSTMVGDGTTTQRKTGTSMSSPIVAGAAARYLAANPGTGPTEMRKLIRAAGRLDWDPRSDPFWSGPNDLDEPNRVLDVAALMAAPGLRAWIYPGNMTIGGGPDLDRVRVDVQRRGGYDGDVTLGLANFPNASATKAYDRPGNSLSGLGGLGARLTVTKKDGGPDGAWIPEVTAEGPGSSPSTTRGWDLLIDTTGPAVNTRMARIKTYKAKLGSGRSVPAIFEWAIDDALSSVQESTLRRKIGSGSWANVFSSPTKRSTGTTLLPGKDYRFRVRGTDSLGNQRATDPMSVKAIVRDSKSKPIKPPDGGWRNRPNSAALGGSLRVGRPGQGRLTTTFWGRSVGIVAPEGPKRGRIQVKIDDGPWATVNLKKASNRHRRIVFSRRLSNGQHTVAIRATQGQPGIDAIIILR